MTRSKLLLADDSVTIRKVVELTFAEEGIDVFAVADGEAAMQKFIEVQPDIVLVDVEMPGPSGFQICEMIKNDAATRHIPVLLLVGSFEPFDQTEAERVQADGFLTKPFQSIRELVIRVTDLLNADEPPETSDIVELYQSSFAETVPIEDHITEEDPFRDTVMDDEMIEMSHPNIALSENGGGEYIAAVATEPIKDFDWSPESKVVEEPFSMAFEPRVAFADREPSNETISDQVTEEIFAPVTAAPAEVSEEMISLIAKRVVEKLSDHVIREIAQDAVPRIAEKLIREALDEENKT